MEGFEEVKNLMLKGQWKTAAAMLTHLLSVHWIDTVQRVTILLKRSECYLETEQFEAVVADCKSVIHVAKDSRTLFIYVHTARSNLVQALFLLNRFTDAEFALREWMALLGKGAEAQNLLKSLHALQGEQRSTMIRNVLSEFIPYENNSEPDSPIVNLHTCIYCNINFHDKDELRGHCQTEDHQLAVMSDDCRDWFWRPPPRGVDKTDYVLCKYWAKKKLCRFSNACVDAHGAEELEEWMQRFEYRRMRIRCAYQEQLLVWFRLAQAEGKQYSHKHSLPPAVMEAIKPTFKALAEPSLLKKCLHGKTQNVNESFNNVIWSRVPKNNFVGRDTLEVGVFDSVITFNDGNIGRINVLKVLGFSDCGLHTVAALKAADESRVRKAERASLEATKEARVQRRRKRLALEERGEADYNPGAF